VQKERLIYRSHVAMISFGFKVMLRLFIVQISIVNHMKGFTTRSQQIVLCLIGSVIAHRGFV
jgi:hypothetical protein